MEQAFKAVRKLVEDFRANERNYLSPTYQEYNVRQDFIDKFFAALGWEVTHERQKNPHEYEVQIENRVPGPGTQRRDCYTFYLAHVKLDIKSEEQSLNCLGKENEFVGSRKPVKKKELKVTNRNQKPIKESGHLLMTLIRRMI